MRTSSAPPFSDGNLAVAPNRQKEVNELVVGAMMCWNHANQPKVTIAEIQHHVGSIKDDVARISPTDDEIFLAQEELTHIGFRIEIAPVRFLIALLLDAPEEEDNSVHGEVSQQFANLVRFPDMRPQGTFHDPTNYEGDTDEQTGNAGKGMCECTGADALRVCNCPPAGMFGDSNIPRDPLTGRFIKRS